MDNMSLIRHPHVIQNLYEYICSEENKRRCFEDIIFFVNTVKVNGIPKTKEIQTLKKKGFEWSISELIATDFSFLGELSYYVYSIIHSKTESAFAIVLIPYTFINL